MAPPEPLVELRLTEREATLLLMLAECAAEDVGEECRIEVEDIIYVLKRKMEECTW